MKIISIEENSTTIEIITEMIFNKKAQLYKTAEDFEIYEIKNSDIKIALISKEKVTSNRKNKIRYNAQIITNLYQSNNLNEMSLIQLYNLNVFM